MRTVIHLNLMKQIYSEEYIKEQEELRKRNKLKNEEYIKFKTINMGFHHKPINKLDVCLQRPILASSSPGDCNVRLWNYMTGSCEVAKAFFYTKSYEEYDANDNSGSEKIPALKTIAIHPCGYYMAVACITKILMTHILDEGMHTFK